MHLRPRASHLQLPQWCCRTAEVKESRKGEELCVSESTEHNSTVMIHTAATQLGRDAEGGDGNIVCCTFNVQPHPLPELLTFKYSNNLLNSPTRREIVQYDIAEGGPWGKRLSSLFTLNK